MTETLQLILKLAKVMNTEQLELVRDIAKAARESALIDAAGACSDQEAIYLSPEYATNQPISSVTERNACRNCARAILALIDKGSE